MKHIILCDLRRHLRGRWARRCYQILQGELIWRIFDNLLYNFDPLSQIVLQGLHIDDWEEVVRFKYVILNELLVHNFFLHFLCKHMPHLVDQDVLKEADRDLYGEVTVLHVVHQWVNALPVDAILVWETFEIAIAKEHVDEYIIEVAHPLSTLLACPVIFILALVFFPCLTLNWNVIDTTEVIPYLAIVALYHSSVLNLSAHAMLQLIVLRGDSDFGLEFLVFIKEDLVAPGVFFLAIWKFIPVLLLNYAGCMSLLEGAFIRFTCWFKHQSHLFIAQSTWVLRLTFALA